MMPFRRAGVVVEVRAGEQSGWSYMLSFEDQINAAQHVRGISDRLRQRNAQPVGPDIVDVHE
jgi:hypothetical protein